MAASFLDDMLPHLRRVSVVCCGFLRWPSLLICKNFLVEFELLYQALDLLDADLTRDDQPKTGVFCQQTSC